MTQDTSRAPRDNPTHKPIVETPKDNPQQAHSKKPHNPSKNPKDNPTQAHSKTPKGQPKGQPHHKPTTQIPAHDTTPRHPPTTPNRSSEPTPRPPKRQPDPPKTRRRSRQRPLHHV
nr:protodermal factor 1-like [Penaeus vannamei]